MTPNRAKITITNPCSENWNSMQVDAVGRFCQSCQKSVIDFSSKSDNEIRTFLKDKQGEKLCGRFFVHQVERIRIEIDRNILLSNVPFWQKFLVVVLVCFGPDFLGTDFVFAQTETDSIPMITQKADSLDSIKAVAEADSTLEVSVDSVQKPVRTKKDHIQLIPYTLLEVMGDFIIAYEKPQEKLRDPDLAIRFVKDQPKEDAVVSKMRISKVTTNKNPVVPKQPKKRSSPLENAIIADANERRKTRRS